jgi:sugar-specific transcriptional regulator TrmB
LGEETIKRVLINSGLTEKETEVYIFLSQHDVRKGTEIAQLLKKDKAQVFRILKRLQTKGFVEATLESPSRFTAVPFENIFNSLVKTKQEEIDFIKGAKKELLDYLSKKQQVETLEKFVVIKGNKKIYAKISQIIRDAKSQVSLATTVTSLMAGDRFGVFDVAFKHPSKTGIKYRFLTDLKPENLKAAKSLIKRFPKTGVNFNARNPDLGLGPFPRMVIKDDEEILFFTSRPEIADRVGKEEVCLWTNCRSLVQAFGVIFEDLWRNSMDIQQKIVEFETGKKAPRTLVLADAETAKKKYFEIMQAAEEEILLMTSSKGLLEHWRNKVLLQNWASRGASVKIMAPIVRENWEAAEQLQKTFEVRHVPENHMLATVVDGKHFFQFKTHFLQVRETAAEHEKVGAVLNFEDIFYTTDLEYVKRMKTTFDELWMNACVPSATPLESVVGLHEPLVSPFLERTTPGKRSWGRIISVKPTGALTEKEVLDKIIHADKTIVQDPEKEVSRRYASIAWAAIHPPSYFNLPSMVVRVEKIEKQSTFGAEDALTIYLWLETASGRRCVPVAIVGDNPKAQAIWKSGSACFPAGQNVQLVGKDELQIRVHGNTMFAGWTIPIPLSPPNFILPPACLLIEGYGNVKTDGFTHLSPSGWKCEIEENYFDAFVTFMHPSSKYSGPGTDGVFIRDFVSIDYPPKSYGSSPKYSDKKGPSRIHRNQRA